MTAASPFNETSADVILRTSDAVDFHVHTLVLSLASTFFESMFSIPQPASTPEQTPVERQIIYVSEDSTTMDALLRYVYPVYDPAGLDLNAVDHILAAATKYELLDAARTIGNVLDSFVGQSPLDVFAISCHHKRENDAKRAAFIWMNKCYNYRGLADAPRYHTAFTRTLMQQCYVPRMAGRITSACYFRLLEYVRDGRPRDFCTVLTASDPKHKTEADGAELSIEEVVRRYPFNQNDADIILRSSDGHDFRVHRFLLEIHLRANQKSK